MRHAWWIAMLVAGCGEGGYSWDAQVLVAAESQRIPAGELPGASALVIASDAGELSYPFDAVDGQLVLRSAFDGEVFLYYDVNATARTAQRDSIVIPLQLVGPRPESWQYPMELPFRAHFEVRIEGTGEPAIPVDLAPYLDPCSYDATFMPPNATSHGVPLRQDATTIHVGKLVLRVVIQIACVEWVS